MKKLHAPALLHKHSKNGPFIPRFLLEVSVTDNS